MTLRPWLQRVRKVLGTSARGHSRRLPQTTPVAAQMETLEPKQLLAAGIIKSGSVVTITGEDSSGKGDVATVTKSESGNQIFVKLTRSSGLSETKTYNTSSVTRIDFFGLKGDDKFDNKVNIDSKAEGGAGNDTLYGGIGNDTIDGGDHDDKIDGRNRKDTLKGGDGNDLIEGGDDLAADELHGGSGKDTLKGQGGADSLYGNGDDDTLKGGEGDDLLQGGGGVDECDGGAGDGDTLLAEIRAGENYDLILTNSRLNNNVLIGIEQAELIGNSKGNLLDASGFTKGSVTLRGGAGNDTLYGGSKGDLLEGGKGNDGLFGGDGADTLKGGADSDRLLVQMNALGSAKDWTPDYSSRDDATISFKDTVRVDTAPGTLNVIARNWTAHEIRQIDVGLAWIHAATNNTRLLKTSDGSNLTFERVDVIEGTVRGRNVWDRNHETHDGFVWSDHDHVATGTIKMSDYAFGTGKLPDRTAVHEIGHNWDTEHENATVGVFRNLSGWTEDPYDLVFADPPFIPGQLLLPIGTVLRDGLIKAEDGNWAYEEDALFANNGDHVRENPREDFATSFADRYMNSHRDDSDAKAKWDYMDAFIKSMRS